MQKLIEEKAKARLAEDIKKLSNSIRENALVNGGDMKMPKLSYQGTDYSNKPQQIDSVPYYVFAVPTYGNIETDNSYMAQLYRYWLPKYIEQEAKEFIEQVDMLKGHVTDLLTFKEQQEDNQC